MNTILSPNRRGLRPVNFGSSFNKMKDIFHLTQDEQKLHDCLLKVQHDSVWGEAIRNVFIDYSVPKFRQLVCDLLSQMVDDEVTMYKILGYDAYQALQKVKP